MFKNQRGQATVEFLIVSLLLFAILFGAVDYWACMVRIQQAEHVKNYYLDRVRLEGCLTSENRTELTNKIENLGFKITKIEAPTDPVKRTLDFSNGYPDVSLSIETEFKNNPFMLGVFLGKDTKPTPKFSGKVLSEYADQ